MDQFLYFLSIVIQRAKKVYLFLVAFTLQFEAATYTWDAGGGATTTWATTTNWNPDAAVTFATGDIFSTSAVFGGSGAGNPGTSDFGALSLQLGGITFSGASAGVLTGSGTLNIRGAVNLSSTNALTFDHDSNAGTAAILRYIGIREGVISTSTAGVVVTANYAGVTMFGYDLATARTYTIGSGTNLTNSGAGDLWFGATNASVNGAAKLTFNNGSTGNILVGAALAKTGTSGIDVTGAGTGYTFFDTANTYTGLTSIYTGGDLRVDTLTGLGATGAGNETEVRSSSLRVTSNNNNLVGTVAETLLVRNDTASASVLNLSWAEGTSVNTITYNQTLVIDDFLANGSTATNNGSVTIASRLTGTSADSTVILDTASGNAITQEREGTITFQTDQSATQTTEIQIADNVSLTGTTAIVFDGSTSHSNSAGSVSFTNGADLSGGTGTRTIQSNSTVNIGAGSTFDSGAGITITWGTLNYDESNSIDGGLTFGDSTNANGNAVMTVATGDTVTLNAGVTYTADSGFANTATISGAGSVNLGGYRDFNIANNSGTVSEMTVTAVLSGDSSAALQKSGAGALVLSAANTFGGSITMLAGELRLTSGGSLASATNASGGTVTGTGTSSDLLLTGANLNAGLTTTTAGDQIGTFNINGGLTVNAGVINIQLGSGNNNNDRINATGTISLNSVGQDIVLTGGDLVNGRTYDLLNFSTLSNGATGLNINFTGTGDTDFSDTFIADIGGPTLYTYWYTGNFAIDGSITYYSVMIPEPSKTLFFALGMTSFLIRRRRK
jgi:autotransporter-associated beta strand protein